MSSTSSKIWVLVTVLIAWALVASVFSMYFYQKYTNLESRYNELVGAVNKSLGEIRDELSTLTQGIEAIGQRFGESLGEVKERVSEIRGILVGVDVGINYGNGTIEWINGTRVIVGTDVLKALLTVADVNYTSGTAGVFVTGINGVNSNSTCGWVFAIYGRSEASWGMSTKVDNWVYPGVSADKAILKDGDIVVFMYYNWVKEGWPPPPPA